MTITPSEFEQSVGSVDFPLAVAVSGGSDSLALLLFTHELAQKKGSHVVALTVDHGLRHESKEEATRIANWAKEKGIKHVILEWEGEKPTSRLQESARKARYALLTQWCKQNEISTLFLGHHQQDQEETFWIRLSSGSGLDGLSGMKKRTLRDGILFLRPFLDFPKERIQETLREKNQEWIEDPSNQSSRFFRGRLRQLFEEEGLSSFRLSQVMKKFQIDADFIQDSLEKAIQALVQIHDGGYITLEKKAFNILHPAIAKRLLSFLLQWFSGADYPPREIQVVGILEKMKRGAPFTMGGIYWSSSQEKIFLLRESRAIQQELVVFPLGGNTLWDQRFWIDYKLKEHVSKEIVIGPLGCVSGLRKEINQLYSNCGSNRNSSSMMGIIPPRAWPTLPALWEKGKLVAVPHLCYNIFGCEKDLRKFFYLKPLFHDSLRFTI